MAAALSTTTFTTTPTAGIDFGAKGSSPPNGIKVLTRVNGSQGHVWLLVKASETIGSIETVKVGTAGSASTDAGSAGWTANVPGGAAAGQYFWAQRTTLA